MLNLREHYSLELQRALFLRTIGLNDRVNHPWVSEVDDHSTWLAQAGHELKTPIHQLIELLQLIEPDHLPVAQRQWLNLARATAAHLEGLSRHLLGEPNALRPWLDLRTMLTDTVAIYTLQATRHALRLESAISADLPCFVGLNGCTLRQILDNLLANALKFTPPGGCIRLEISIQSEELWIEVSDSGAGIDEGQHDYIFEPCVQLRQAIVRSVAPVESTQVARYDHHLQDHGAGLGLFLARKLTLALGGTLLCLPVNSRTPFGSQASEPLSGAHFRLTLPLRLPDLQPEFSVDSTTNPDWPERLCHSLGWAMADAPESLSTRVEALGQGAPMCLDGRDIQEPTLINWLEQLPAQGLGHPLILLVTAHQRWMLSDLYTHPTWSKQPSYVVTHPSDFEALNMLLPAPSKRRTDLNPDLYRGDPNLDNLMSSPAPVIGPKLDKQVLVSAMAGKQWLYLTLDTCDCIADVQATIEQLGLRFHLHTYPEFPPAPQALLETYGQQMDYLCLCTTDLPHEQVQQWLSSSQWEALGQASRIQSLLLYQAPSNTIIEKERLLSLPVSWRPSATFHSLETLPRLMWNLLNTAASEIPASAPTVLMIEDNPISQLIQSHQLSLLGIRTINTTSLAQAAQQVSAGFIPDLVLVDTHLPDGLSPAEQIRVLRNAGLAWQTPLISLSAYPRDEDKAAACAAGFDLCLAKPVVQSQWRAVLRHLLPERTVFQTQNTLDDLQACRALSSSAIPAAEITEKSQQKKVSPMDWEGLLLMLRGDEGLARRIVRLFVQDTPVLLAELTTSLQSAAWAQVVNQAHQLKGSALYLHALPLRDLAYQLELMALRPEQLSPSSAEQLLHAIGEEYVICQQFLNSIIDGALSSAKTRGSHDIQ